MYVAVGVAAASYLSTANADCFADAYTNKAFQVGSPNSKAIQTKNAKDTWQDWIWRGPIRRCTADSKNKCTYQWMQANTKGYQWSVGGEINGGNIPIIGGILSLIAVNGSYGKNKSYTETFGWMQTFDGNVFVQPVQVIQRRWIGGNFKGTFWRTASSCKELVWAGAAWADWPGAHYWWEDGYRWGKWSTNAEQYRYAMYHWWKA